VLIGFALFTQFIASIFPFLPRDGTAATAMAVLAGTWLVVALACWTRRRARQVARSLVLLVAARAVGIAGLTAAIAKLVPGTVFMVAALRFVAVAV
jgi:hypothetical protein